jgi:hypothetical protein
VGISGVAATTTTTPVQTITPAKARDEAKTAEVPRSKEQSGRLPESVAKQIREAGLKEAVESTRAPTEPEKPGRAGGQAGKEGKTTEDQKESESSESGGLKESRPSESGGPKGSGPKGGSEVTGSKPFGGGDLKGSGRPDIRTRERDLPQGYKTYRK